MLTQKERYKIINGDSLVELDKLEDNSIDACITDPPYELGFMGKKWDATGIAYNVELWKKVWRVLKPGAYLLAFGGTRTYHRICCAIEDAGFEIRDCIMWLYGSGFPKSMNIGLAVDKRNGVESEVVGINKSVQDLKEVGKITGHKMTFGQEGTENCARKDVPILKAKNEWNGWGTCLKPAYEPIIVARKPVEESVINNVLKYGVGGINIDECKVGNETVSIHNAPKGTFAGGDYNRGSDTESYRDSTGRFPANVILTYDESDYDEVCGNMPDSKGSQGQAFSKDDYEERETATSFTRGDFIPYNDDGSACRYFYCAKASKKDRDNGLIWFDSKTTGELQGGRKEGSAGSIMKNADGTTRVNPYAGTGAPKKNIHPTVKPVDLMQYLVRLVSPKGSVILDIFNGSGSTGKAVAFENREREADYKYIGIELDPEYCKISESRIDYAVNQYVYDVQEEIQENAKKGQLSLFDFES